MGWYVLAEVIGWIVATAVEAVMPRGTTRARGSLQEIAARHPRSVVRRARLTAKTWNVESDRENVEFVVANRRGLSFRDAYNAEHLEVPRFAVYRMRRLSDDGARLQHIRAVAPDGSTSVEFWSSADAGDVVADLETALGSSAE